MTTRSATPPRKPKAARLTKTAKTRPTRRPPKRRSLAGRPDPGTQQSAMITVFSPEHLLRNAKTELYGGRLVPPHECPERAEIVLERVRAVGLGEIMAPSPFRLAPGRKGD